MGIECKCGAKNMRYCTFDRKPTDCLLQTGNDKFFPPYSGMKKAIFDWSINNGYNFVDSEVNDLCDCLEVAPIWRPIETAPKDGTHFLALDYDGFVKEMSASTEDEIKDDGYSEFHYASSSYAHPTHWMPLPKHPTPANGGSDE